MPLKNRIFVGYKQVEQNKARTKQEGGRKETVCKVNFGMRQHI